MMGFQPCFPGTGQCNKLHISQQGINNVYILIANKLAFLESIIGRAFCAGLTSIYYYSSRTGDSFAGGPISVDYSIRKLQHVIEKRAIKSYKNSQNLLHRDVSA